MCKRVFFMTNLIVESFHGLHSLVSLLKVNKSVIFDLLDSVHLAKPLKQLPADIRKLLSIYCSLIGQLSLILFSDWLLT